MFLRSLSSPFVLAAATACSLGALGGSDFFLSRADSQVAPVIVEEESKPRTDAKVHGVIVPDQDVRPVIYKVVLTGGPCSGKSTAVSLLSRRLDSLDFKVLVVPEAATLLFTGGARPDSSFHSSPLTRELVFETQKVNTQIALESAFYKMAEAAQRPTVIICDRGTMDSAAYVGPEKWNIMLQENGWTVAGLRDNRYDAVLHLVTTAIGAEAFYTSENNDTRSEDVAQARELDLRVLNAWVGHGKLTIVDNSTDFKGKMDRVVTTICRLLGVPKPKSTERKFLVRKFSIPPSVQSSKHYTETTFLVRDNQADVEQGYIFVSKRGDTPATCQQYTYSAKHVFPDGESAVVERQISGMEYNMLLAQKDSTRNVARKKVRSFLWNNHYFQLFSYLEPHPGLVILKTEAEHPEQKIELPPFVHVIKEVTDDPRFSTYQLASQDVTWIFSQTKT